MNTTKYILIVEDNPDNSCLAEKILNFYHFSTRIAVNGTEALMICDSSIPALILMDLSLPDMDGFQVTEQLRKKPEFSKVPIIALSAHSMQDMENLGKKAGLNDFLAKPFLPAQLISKINEHL